MTEDMPSQSPETLDLVFWAVGHRDLPFSSHLEIAEAGGFTSLAVAPSTFKHLAAQGFTANDLLEQAGERGLKFTQLDGVAAWVDSWYPVSNNSDVTRNMRNHFDVSMQEALDIGEALKMTSAVAVGFFDKDSIALDAMVEAFGKLCDAARPRGLRMDLEFIPMWGIPELPLAWEIVKTADCDNSGLMVDTWHMQKGSSDFERDIALLNQIPGHRLRNVQLADADLERHGTSFFDDVRFRKFAGEGELDITRILTIIASKGCLQSIGPEVVGHRLSGVSTIDIGRVAGRTTREAIELAYAPDSKTAAI